MKRLHWLFFMMCLAVLPALQSCDDLDDGYSIGDFSYPNWSTVRVKGNTFYLESDTWGTLWPINTNMGWYQPVDGQRIITIFNPIYDNYEGYDHAVKIEKIWHALTKSVEPLTSENDEEYGNDPVFIYKGDMITFISFVDDIRSTSQSLRLVFHFAAMVLMFYQWDLFSLSWWWIIVALIICTGIINAYNFMDGINGITGCYSLIILGALAYINEEMVSFAEPALIYTVLCSVVVFCFFNFRRKAKCFAAR